MKKATLVILVLALTAALSFNAFAASKEQGGFQPSPALTAGGFTGPGVSTTTVEQAKTMRDDSPVVLRGNIVQHLGKDKYLFKDATGTIHVEIDNDKWGGVTVSPATIVELHGEVDKDWNSVEIDVDRVVNVQ